MRNPLLGAASLALFLPLALAGCNSNAVQENQTTFLTADDLQRMTDQMAHEIVANDYLRMQPAPLKIVIKPVINETSEIIPGNRAQLFVARLQGLLAQEPTLRDRFVWIMNKHDYEILRNSEISTPLGPDETAITPEYALYAKFVSKTDVSINTRSDLYLCQYYLTRIAGRQ